MEIKLASHEHSMPYYCFHEDDDKRCRKCRAKISGAAYACLKCECCLHASCAKALEHLPREITHPLHPIPRHNLILEWSGIGGRFICHNCLNVSYDTNYGCCRCDFELDLTCALAIIDDQAMKNKQRPNSDRDKQKIQHYCHGDQLILYQLGINIEEHDYNCNWCDKPLKGNVYGCLLCEFFLHEFCTNKIPKTLSHPFHPLHPLCSLFLDKNTNCNACTQVVRLRAGATFSYCCKECNFNLDFHCAKLLPTLKHKCHDHYLSYFGPSFFNDKDLKYHFKCNSCHELCLDNFYRCVQCDLNLHLKCVPIPLLANHRYHRHPLVLKNSVREDDFGEYYCDVCEEERDPTHHVYFCEKCTYIAHIECMLNEENTSARKISSSASASASASASELMDSKALTVKEMDQIGTVHNHQHLVRPLIHEHPLKFCEVTEDLEVAYKYCKACRLALSGPGYICERCPLYTHGYYLHEKCSQLPIEMQHPLHFQHRLSLHTQPPRNNFFLCDECRDFSDGFIYICEECDFKLDVKCATQAANRSGLSTLKDQAARETELFHFSHKHKLIFCNYRDPIYKRPCNLCRLAIIGPAYNCFHCIWILHESCAKLPQMMRLQLHPQHMSLLCYTYTSNYAWCDICGVKLLAGSFRYSCEECDQCFHITCANSVGRALKRDSHEHDLYYFGVEFQPLFDTYWDFPRIFAGKSCSHCGQLCSEQAFYRCLECGIDFHLECVTIPQIVKSQHHLHPVTLKDAFIEDDSGEYYCDVCEEERHPSDHVYYCEECDGQFVSHIDCVLDKEEEVLSYLVPREWKKRTR